MHGKMCHHATVSLLAVLIALWTPGLSPAGETGEESEPTVPEITDTMPEPAAPPGVEDVYEQQRAFLERLEGTLIIRGEVVDAAGEPIEGVDVRIVRHTVDNPHGEPEEYETVDHRFVFRFEDVTSVYLQFTRGDHLISELEAFRALPELARQAQTVPQDFTTTVQLELVENTVELPEVVLLVSHLPDESHYIHGIDEGVDSGGRAVPVFLPQRVSAPVHDLYPPFLAAGIEQVEYDLEPLRDREGRALSPRNAVGRLHLEDGQDGGLIVYEPGEENLSRFQVMRRMMEAPESGYDRSITFTAEDYAYVDRLDPVYVWAKLLGFHAKGTIDRVYYGPEGFHVLLRLRIQPDGSRHLATRD